MRLLNCLRPNDDNRPSLSAHLRTTATDNNTVFDSNRDCIGRTDLVAMYTLSTIPAEFLKKVMFVIVADAAAR